MKLHKTGHPIADTVSDLIGDLPDDNYAIAYGILRGSAEYLRSHRNWFEIDKGFWGAEHYGGNYRLSYLGTQPRYDGELARVAHDSDIRPWRRNGDYILVCPPTDHVCNFFNISPTAWLTRALREVKGVYYVRHKGDSSPIDWDGMTRLVTFNSTLGVEALRRGIPVISDPDHSSIGSYTKNLGIDRYDREPLFSFLQAHMFKLEDKGTICRLISYYLSTLAGIHAKP